MSQKQREASILILQIIGFIFITVTLVLGGLTVICALGLEAPNMRNACSNGSLKEVAFTIIGAAGALWGANLMKESGK